MAAHLPKTLEEFPKAFGNASLIEVMKKIKSPAALTPTETNIWKYSGGALLLGRPLDTVMIFMGGSSGAGKSTTINTLFEDNELCSTSSSTSETKEPVRLRKTLKVTKESPPVVGNLTFVDVPGAFDTDGKNEVANFASIKKFRESSIELQSRKKLANLKIPNVTATVYPNIILFVLNAMDNRIVGPNSFFRKSLESFKLHDLFDKNHPNLIIVLSHARSLGGKAKFATLLQQKTNDIRKIIHEILGVSDVEVVPVENEGEDQELEKRGDFYVLPNGELSHYNLFQAMIKVFTRNEDLMGRLFAGWYFGSNCPEKKQKVEVETSQIELEPLDVALAGQALKDLQFAVSDESIVPQYNFSSLGCGFCPVSEEVKPVYLLSETGDASALQSKVIEIESSKFLIPNFINAYIKKTSRFQRISFYEKEEYQNHMKASYGIEAGFKLIVSASSEGRWISGAQGSYGSSLVKMVQEIQMATFKLDNPRGRVTHSKFIQELNSLPSTFTNDTAKDFRNFFSKWGTHIIYEEAVGGSIQLKCTLQSTSLTKEKLQEIEGQVSAIFKGFSGSGHVETDALSKGLKTVGVSNEQLEIDGGDPPAIITLESVNAAQLQEWAKSIPKKPVELRQSIKLYPYYNFLDNGEQCESLRQATAVYLEDTLNAKIQTAIDRNTASEKAVEDTVDEKPKGPPCFPKGTLVELWNGERKQIEQLSLGCFPLKTMGFGNSPLRGEMKLDKIAKTNFCTFLDAKSSKLVEYLVFHFSNGKKLIVTEAHMIFQYIPDRHQVKGKQAKNFKIGELSVFLNPTSGEMETPAIEEITKEMHVGAYSPLTMSGTFFADGFLVSSYANTNSFLQAQMALFPLKMWCSMNRKGVKKQMDVNNEQTSALTKEGIHPYAKFLMQFRKSFTSMAPSQK
ncbi:Protein hedgehog [Orchesella cincta]|uniref:Protein hedgehog n=1 Tax=Orchesella cincta TaxID=48709 RepID=A0A1D2MHX8_ORCCI|nr:Protein hedgehog [Orchesella cincta]